MSSKNKYFILFKIYFLYYINTINMNTNDKIKDVEMEISKCKKQVEAVIINVIERGDKLEDIQEESLVMADMANLFSKKAYKVRRKMCCEEYKAKLLLLFMVLCILTFIGASIYYGLK